MLTLLLLMGINITVDSRIDSVIIYSDRVMVSRVANIYLDKSAELIFADLPGSLDDQSVRIKANGLAIGEVQIQKGYTAQPHPRIKELEDKIKSLEQKDRALSDELAVVKEKEKFLQTISVGAPDVISKEVYTGKISPSAWEQGLKFMVDGLLSTKSRTAQIERERKDLQTELDTLRRKYNDTKALIENRKTIKFDARPDKLGNYRIELNYILYGASWKTYYELRANPSKGNIALTYFGKISQRTGEDWDDTKIILSTGKPALGGTAPTPEPWYIYSYEYETEIRAPMAAPAEVAKEAVSEIDQIITYQKGAPAVEAGISVWYPLPGRYSIKSGEPEKKIQIYETNFNADFEYLIIPRLSELAYSTGKFQNKSDYLFLAGEAGTYVGDDFTGRTNFHNLAPDESTTVSFGVDEMIKVQRELKKSKVTKGGLFKKIKKHELLYENSIKNFRNKEINCTIIDQVPVSQEADIKVTDIKLEPKPSEEDKDRGIYYWKVTIKPGETFKIKSSFSVEAPETANVEEMLY
ncbi:MAG: mucoidy inhibitor MuiA family protein [candidate division WOR-3 bacterium]